MDAVSNVSESSAGGLTSDMTATELTTLLTKKLKAVRPVDLYEKAPSMQEVWVFLDDFKDAKAADETWRIKAPKNAISR